MCLNLWYELNPRVRCAFGNVYTSTISCPFMSLFVVLFSFFLKHYLRKIFPSHLRHLRKTFCPAFSHSNRVHKTQLGNNMLTFVKVLVQANLEYGQMREMVHSYQHRLAQARLHIMINDIIIIFASNNIPILHHLILVVIGFCCQRRTGCFSWGPFPQLNFHISDWEECFKRFDSHVQMPTLNNGKKKESHAEAELRRDLKKVRCLQRKMGMITFPRRRDFYNTQNLQ